MVVPDRYRMTLFHECQCRLSSTAGPRSNSDQKTKRLRRTSQKLVPPAALVATTRRTYIHGCFIWLHTSI